MDTIILARLLRKVKREAAKMALAALAFTACICLAEWLAGSGWGYLPAAMAATLAANACAGAVLNDTREETHHG